MIVKYIIPLLIFCVGVFSTSCDDMDALHIGFLEEGETIYAAKVDSASVGPGNGRVKMELFINAQRIEKLRIYWNAYTDSIDFNVGGQVGEFSLMIENLPEREYLFQIVSLKQQVELAVKIIGIPYLTVILKTFRRRKMVIY